MSRQLTLTAAEWASVQPDGTLWLAWEGVTWGTYHLEVNAPPAVFAQACAPCETCGDHRSLWHIGTVKNGRPSEWRPCPDCRIELVGPCGIDGCRWSPHRTLGHAYAIGQPLPIITQPPHHRLGWPKHTFIGAEGGRFWLRSFTAPAMWEPTDLTAALAHYGPPETLVGRWAMQLRVTP